MRCFRLMGVNPPWDQKNVFWILRRFDIQDRCRKQLGDIQESRNILNTECVFSYAPGHSSDASDDTRTNGNDVTIIVYRADAKSCASAGPNIALGIPNIDVTPSDVLQQRRLGERLILGLRPTHFWIDPSSQVGLYAQCVLWEITFVSQRADNVLTTIYY